MSEDAFELNTVELKDAVNELRNLPADHYRLVQKCVIKDDTISIVPPEIGRLISTGGALKPCRRKSHDVKNCGKLPSMQAMSSNTLAHVFRAVSDRNNPLTACLRKSGNYTPWKK